MRDDILSEEGLDRLRDELQRQARSRTRRKRKAPEGRQRSIADLDRKIERGVERLLIVEPEDVPAAQAKLTEWLQEREPGPP